MEDMLCKCWMESAVLVAVTDAVSFLYVQVYNPINVVLKNVHRILRL